MNDEQINIAIAESQGWRFGETGPKGKWWMPPPPLPFKATLAKDLPQYTTDFNRMQAILVTLPKKVQQKVCENIHSDILTAPNPARDVAIAYLKTLNLYTK